MKRLMIAAMMMVSATVAAPALAEEEHEEAFEIELFQGYMDVAEQFITFANRKDAAVFFAIEGIVEIHEQRGELAAAIPLVKGVLDQYPDNLAVRNLARFKLRDLYRDTGQADLALAEMQLVIEENR